MTNRFKIVFSIVLLSSSFAIFAQETMSTEDLSISGFNASCRSVSSEVLIFTEDLPGIYYAHDSIAFDAECVLTCDPISNDVTVEQIKDANPLPGTRDTAVFVLTSQDLSLSATYKVIVARSLYQTKFGFLAEIDQTTSEFDGWTFSGKRYPSAKRGNGASYPGEKAMRIYNSTGTATTPKFSSVSTLSFVAKFSYTDDETLVIQKSYDGTTFTDIKSYTPGVEIPAYSGEDAGDALSSTQTIDINDEDIYLRFKHQGVSADTRIMFDDVAVRAEYDYTPEYNIEFSVLDFDRLPLSGAQITIDDAVYTTDLNGRLFLGDLTPGELKYSVSYNNYFTHSDSVVIKGSTMQEVILLDEELEIFLASGQSNMAGRADIEDNTAPIEGAYLMDDENKWWPVTNPMNLYSNIRKDADDQKLGPSYTFAETMTKYLDKRVCIIVNARGGTHIREFIEGGDYHEALMERFLESKKLGTVKAVIWHQGEAGSSTYSLYLSRLHSLVTKMRDTLESDFYFVAGQLGPWYDKYKGFNDNLENIASEIENASYVENTSLWHLGDSSHFNTESQLLYGRRYAKSVLAAVYDIDVAVFKVDIEGDVFVSVGEDTLRSSGSFTSLWDEQAVIELHAPAGDVFESLLIDEVEQTEALGLSVYSFVPSSSDAYFQVQATSVIDPRTSISESINSEVLIYPNPTSGVINFSNEQEYYKATLYNLLGCEVFHAEHVSSLDLSSMSAGCYMLKLTSGDTSSLNKIILK